MKKRVLSLLLCLVMALSLVPVTAHAVDYYGVMVGNTPITSDNYNDVFGDGTVSYTHDADRNRGTLTLDGANITTGYKDTANNRTVGIYSSHDLTVYVGQDGGRVDLHNSKCSGSSYGIYVDGVLTFYSGYEAPKPMTVISAAGTGSNYGAYATGDIIIDTFWGVVEAIAFIDFSNFSSPGYGMAVSNSHKISIEDGHLYAMSYYGAATSKMPILNNYYNDVIDKQYVFKGNSGSGMEDIQPTSSPSGLMELRVQRMFPDRGLWKFLMDRFDKDGSYYLDEEERNSITAITGTTTASTRSAIKALEGLEYLPNLTTIDCHNELIESADLTQCPQLETLNLNRNNLTKLDVRNCPNLTELRCNYNKLTSLDVSNNTKLTNLYCYENPIKALDVSMCPNLVELECASLGSSTLETLTVGQKNALKDLYCPSVALKSVDVTDCPNLESLESGYASGGVIDLSKNTQLKSAHLYGYKGNKLDLTHNTKLESLYCSQDSNLTSLDLSKCPNLNSVQIPSNGLTSLDLSNNTKLERMYCQNNPLTSINVSKCSALEILDVDNCKLTTLNVNNNPNLVFLFCVNNNLTALNIGNKPNLLKIDCYGNKLSELDLSRTHIGSNTANDVYRAFVGDQQNDGMITVYTTKALVNTLKSYFNLHSEDHNHFVLVEDAANYVPSAPAAPSISISNTASTGKPRLSWKAVSGATEYEVYRATSKTGTYTKLTTTSNLYLNNTSAVAGTTYYYKVRALNAGGTASEYSNIVYITCDCAKPVVKVSANSSGKPYLSWAKVDGATSYEVYYATSASGEFTKLYTTSNLYLNHNSAAAGKTYYYKVLALSSKSSYATSAYSDVVSIKVAGNTAPAAPSISISNNASTGKPRLSWKAVSGATQYEVYRATSKTGEYTKLTTTSNLYLNNTSAVAGTTYYYKVRALNAGGTAGEYSNIVYITCDCAKPVVSVKLNSSNHPYISWAKVDGATSYEVYYATSAGGEFTKLYTTSNLYLNHNSAKAGTTYYYKVLALSSKSSYATSAYSDVVSIQAK